MSLKEKILRGAFVELDYDRPEDEQRLVVPFQFNPKELSRSRSVSYGVPKGSEYEGEDGQMSLRDFHRRDEFRDLSALWEAQVATITEESISFELLLDASEEISRGSRVAKEHGISPYLAALELMLYPRGEAFAAAQAADEWSQAEMENRQNSFSFTDRPNPPMILFTWGRKKVLPVNIESLNITETDYSPELEPVRAKVQVSLKVIEAPASYYVQTLANRARDLARLDLDGVGKHTEWVMPDKPV